MTETPKLKPCPFCGSEANFMLDNGVTLSGHYTGFVHCVSCTSVNADVAWNKDKSECMKNAADIWNHRSNNIDDLPPLPKGWGETDDGITGLDYEGDKIIFAVDFIKSKNFISFEVIESNSKVDNQVMPLISLEVALHLRAMLDKAIKEAKGK